MINALSLYLFSLSFYGEKIFRFNEISNGRVARNLTVFVNREENLMVFVNREENLMVLLKGRNNVLIPMTQCLYTILPM